MAQALEALQRIAPQQPVRTLRQSQAGVALKLARTCYDHLAGELGVAITEALVNRELLQQSDDSFMVTSAGRAWFGAFGIDITTLEQARRGLAHTCLDWTERRSHLAGGLGAALAERFFARRFVRRLPGGRAIKFTPNGAQWLEHELALHLT